jgi:hypothetical protein
MKRRRMAMRWRNQSDKIPDLIKMIRLICYDKGIMEILSRMVV